MTVRPGRPGLCLEIILHVLQSVLGTDRDNLCGGLSAVWAHGTPCLSVLSERPSLTTHLRTALGSPQPTVYMAA